MKEVVREVRKQLVEDLNKAFDQLDPLKTAEANELVGLVVRFRTKVQLQGYGLPYSGPRLVSPEPEKDEE